MCTLSAAFAVATLLMKTLSQGMRTAKSADMQMSSPRRATLCGSEEAAESRNVQLEAHLQDAGACGLSEAQRDHPQLGQLIQPLVIRDGAHQHRNLALVLLVKMATVLTCNAAGE